MSRKEKKAQKELEKAQAKLDKVQEKESKPKKSKGKIIGIAAAIIVVLAIIGGALPETDSSNIEVNMEDYPAWVDFTVDKSAPASDTDALLEAAKEFNYNYMSPIEYEEYLNDTFTDEKADYVRQNLTVSWNPVCGKEVDELYADGLSRADIENQLKDRGFSDESLEYVQVNLDNKDFYQSAYDKAVEYHKDDDAMSADEIAYQIHAVDNFTEDEAIYAVQQLILMN